MGLDRFCHKNAVRHRFGDDKMFNFTKSLKRNRLVLCKQIRCHWSISTIICICTIAYEDYIIYSCLCNLPTILCCAFTYFPHLSTRCRLRNRLMPNGTVYNAIFLNLLPQLIFLYLSANSYRNIDYYCT